MVQTRILVSFSSIQRSQIENEYEAVLLAPGVHNGITFLAEEIARGVESFNRVPVNLDHGKKVVDEVGYVKNVRFDEGKMRGTLVLTPETAQYGVARAFIENRLRAERAPEVSVGVYLTEEVLEREDAPSVIVARELVGDHLALVTRGACGPDSGCGVGLAKKENLTMKPEPTPAPATAPATETAPATVPAETAPATETAPVPTPEEQAANIASALAAEDPAPCGCRELEASLLAEMEAHKATTKSFAEFRETLTERVALVASATALGLEADLVKTDLAVLRADVQKAQRVAAHLAKQGSPSTRMETILRATDLAPEGDGSAPAVDPITAEAQRYLDAGKRVRRA